jgi:hypothetical protein
LLLAELWVIDVGVAESQVSFMLAKEDDATRADNNVAD